VFRFGSQIKSSIVVKITEPDKYFCDYIQMDDRELNEILEESRRIRREIRETRFLIARRTQELKQTRIAASSRRDEAREMLEKYRNTKDALAVSISTVLIK
jgi:hypothetical protein